MTQPVPSDGEDLGRFREYLRTLARWNFPPELQQQVDPSDLVQETLLKAYTSKEKSSGRSDKERAAWLRRILSHTIADAIKAIHRDKRDVGLERSLDAAIDESSARLEKWLAAEQSSPSQQAIFAEGLEKLHAALAALPDDQRIAIELYRLQGNSVAEIAEKMQRTEAAVAGLIRRGMKQLRSRLESKS